ncbi:MAG TPA: hypothetical protein VIB79_20250 [Candidatus Binatia bacterium]
MIQPVYICLGAIVLLMSVGKIVWRHDAKASDWSLVVAFIRLDFPPDQRSVAQKIAAGLAEIVGMKIKQLRPEHTLRQIAGWASDERVRTGDLSKIFFLAFDIVCDENTTFRAIVEKVAENQSAGGVAASK